MKNTPSVSAAPHGTTPPRHTATRLTPMIAAIASSIMAMTASAPAHAGDTSNQFQFGVINSATVKKGGGGGTARAQATATAAADMARDTQTKLDAAKKTLEEAMQKAIAAETAAKDAQTRLTAAEARLTALETRTTPSVPSTDDTRKKDVKKGCTEQQGGDKDCKDDNKDGSDTTPTRAPTPEEIVRSKTILEARAQVTNTRLEVARAKASAKAARVIVRQAQADKTNAALEVAQATAAEKAEKLALAQAEAATANANATGLESAAKDASDKLAEAICESDKANKELACAEAEAARAMSLVNAFGTPSSRYSSSSSESSQRSVVMEERDDTPPWYGEVYGTFGVASVQERGSVKGGVGLSAFARIGDNVALGVKSNIEASGRDINVGGQTVPGSSTAVTVQGAVQLGTVRRGSGFNFEGAAGMQRASMNGRAEGSDGAKLEGVRETYARVDLGANYYTQISDAFRLKVGAAATFLVGQPDEMGSAAKKTAVGATFNIGVSTK